MAEGTPNIKANKTYSADFKLKVIESAKSTNNSAAGRAHHVDVRCVRRWRKQEKLIKRQDCEGAKTRVRLPGGGKKPRSHEMEEILFDWIISMRRVGLRVTRQMINLFCYVIINIDLIRGLCVPNKGLGGYDIVNIRAHLE